MNSIQDHFDETFAHWDIRLPVADVAKRQRGKIVKAGWSIWYLFGADRRGEYMEYYASHRMTSDRHIRIYTNGEEKALPSIGGMRICSKDPDEDKRLEAEFYSNNARIARLLKRKGIGIIGDEPLGIQIKRRRA